MEKMVMFEKKLVALSLICVVLCVAVVGAVMVVNQKDRELQTRADQISGLENDRLSLEAQVASLQSEITSLNSEKTALKKQVSTLQTNITALQIEVTALQNKKSVLEMQVSALQAIISDLQSDVGSLNDDKIALETQVADFQSEITSLNSEKATLYNQVSTLQTNITVLQTNITVLQTEIASLEDEVVESFNLGYSEGEAAGYQVGYDAGYAQGVEDGAGSGWYIRDPTYAEAIAFINSDRTDENEYTDEYVCYDFTADFNTNAFQLGYRCGFVYIEFLHSAHAIACFNTTDRGLIYVEPQNDEIVDVAVGLIYTGHVIVKMGIIW
jgi:peptidoglycan hydrolase CwlO-like protein